MTTTVTRGVEVSAPEAVTSRSFRRPDGGGLRAWSTILRYHAGDEPGLVEDVAIDGRRKRRRHPKWPDKSAKDDLGRKPWGQCHNLQIFGSKRGARPEGLVIVRRVTSLDAVADGLLVSYACRVLIEDCAIEGDRAGLAVSGHHVEAMIRRCSANQLHYEPESTPGSKRPGRFHAEDVRLFGRAHIGILPKAADERCSLTRCDAKTLAYHDARPDLLDGYKPRLVVTDCRIGDVSIVTPTRFRMVGGAVGALRVSFQTRYRKWEGGVVTFVGVKMPRRITVKGVGTLVIDESTAPITVNAHQVAGFSPSEDTPLVIWRDGIETRITAPGAYDV